MRRIERQRTRHCAAAHSRSHVRARRVGVQRCSVSYECIVYMQVGVCSQQSLPLFCFQSLGKNILVCLYVKSILEFFFVGLITKAWKVQKIGNTTYYMLKRRGIWRWWRILKQRTWTRTFGSIVSPSSSSCNLFKAEIKSTTPWRIIYL